MISQSNQSTHLLRFGIFKEVNQVRLTMQAS